MLRATRAGAALTLAVAAVARAASAEPAACYTIQPGDTAAYLALRLTGSADHRDEPWFQIVDPMRRRTIPKLEYRRIHPGWQACVPEVRLAIEWRRPAETNVAAHRTAAGIIQALVADPAVVPWAGGALLLVLMVASRLAYMKMDRRLAALRVMESFGERFIHEFERPLRQPGVEERPLQARMRLVPRRGQVEILLAPNGARTYPNLADHRRNVTYDVARVLRVIADPRFTGGELYTRGRWVVVPCRLNLEPK